MIYKFPLKVPTFDHETSIWSETVFEKREDFLHFVESIIKEPGEYEFDETVSEWNKHATYFNIHKSYEGRKYPELTRDRKKWWNTEKNKCRKGVIYKNKGKVFYVTRFYYDWLNFMKIYDKVVADFVFPKIWDTHYDLALCVVAAELCYKNIPLLKKRQMGASLFFLGLIINAFWFERGAVLKLGASLGAFLGMEDGCWKTLDFYRSFRNEHTDWYRECNPDKVGNWIQQREAVQNGKKTNVGRKSSIKAASFEKSPTNGVGGPTTYMFHEEGGIAPKADTTFGYMDPAMRVGQIRTGMFIISGSVGELSQCKPLEKWIRKPGSDFYSRRTKYYDEKGTEGICGLFIPEQWSMPPFIDEFGNSLVELAIEAILQEREELREQVKRGEKSEEDYRLHVSQHPMNIKEAFAWREESKFPIHIVEKQKQRIEDGEVFVEHLDIERDANGKPVLKPCYRSPLKFPTEKTLPDKRGCLIVSERPPEIIQPNVYFASIDPVGEGKSTTSESLFSVIIAKMPIEKEIHTENGVKFELDQSKIVCTWTGRFDDINDTHEYASMLLEIYGARAVVESNVSLFINFMILKKRQKYLIAKDELIFLKEWGGNSNAHYEYGWKNTGRIFKDHLMSYGIESVKEVINEDFTKEGKSVKKHYGVERIPDVWLLEEMLQYREDLNVDRLVSYCALMAYLKLRIANYGYKKVKEVVNLENNKNLYNLNIRSPFKNIGKSNFKNENPKYNFKRTTFKNLR
jgi:hypothetical protein